MHLREAIPNITKFNMETLAKAEKFIESHLSSSTKRNRGEEFEPGGSADCIMTRRNNISQKLDSLHSSYLNKFSRLWKCHGEDSCPEFREQNASFCSPAVGRKPVREQNTSICTREGVRGLIRVQEAPFCIPSGAYRPGVSLNKHHSRVLTMSVVDCSEVKIMHSFLFCINRVVLFQTSPSI